MRRWPWIMTIIIAVLVVSPLGQDVYRSLHSGEGLSRNIAQIALIVYGPILLVLALLEWLIRWRLDVRRKIPRAANPAPLGKHKHDRSEA